MKEVKIKKQTKKMVFLEVDDLPKPEGFWFNLWGAFNQSRCKTALLLGSVLIWGAFIITEIMGNPSIPTQQASTLVFIYWMGRHSKSQENIAVCTRMVRKGGE